MNYFYSTRRDKRGNTLLTSYDTKTSVDKYGGDGKIEHTVYYINPRTGAINTEGGDDFIVLRSIMLNASTPRETPLEDVKFRFVVMAKRAGEWFDLGQSFAQYGQANNLMKSVMDMYEAVAVVDTSIQGGDPVRSASWDMDEGLDITTEGNLPWK